MIIWNHDMIRTKTNLNFTLSKDVYSFTIFYDHIASFSSASHVLYIIEIENVEMHVYKCKNFV